MSIAIHFIEGLSCPYFVCDVCGKRITDQARAMAAWGELLTDKRDHDPLTPAHVHKGACLDIFETRLAEGQGLMTDELRTHLGFLANNSKSEAQRVRRKLQAPAPDIGPMARFNEVIADPSALGVILCRLGEGESLRAISRAWRIPRLKLREWVLDQGARLLNSRRATALRLVTRTEPAPGGNQWI